MARYDDYFNEEQLDHIRARIQALEGALAGERERCAKVAEESMTVECCNNPKTRCLAIDETTGECLRWEQECCGSPSVTPHYPDQIAAAIRALPAPEGSAHVVEYIAVDDGVLEVRTVPSSKMAPPLVAAHGRLTING